MSRFDDELVKHADNEYQIRGLPNQTTPTPTTYEERQGYQPYGDALVPSEVPVKEEAADWVANQPVGPNVVQVTDFTNVDKGTEILGGPGNSAVYAEGGPVQASVNPIDESLYQVYKASREIRDAIKSETDFDFNNLITAANDATTVMRFASADDELNVIIGTVAGIVTDIENDLVATGDYRQASADLKSLESLLDDLNKTAARKSCKNCHGEGCEECDPSDEVSEDDEKKEKKKDKKKKKKAAKLAALLEATNGNQETLKVVDVRDLDDQAGAFTREEAMTPDHTTNALEAESVNGDAAGYVPFYNDGAETGIVPQQDHHKEPWPYDASNPALVPYNQVQASREKLFESLQIVERLEKLGMVNTDNRAKHIAKFEQMSDAKLAGFKASLDMLEESGARQPRSQKVAGGTNRLPEMGRLTTASTVSRQQLIADDWLMTL
jgi:hypothetical protein